MGPGTRGKQTSLVLFLFFARERDVNERASSDTCEAGFNEMRVHFLGYGAIGEGSHDLIAIYYLYLKKNLNAPRPSEHPPVRGKKCQNV